MMVRTRKLILSSFALTALLSAAHADHFYLMAGTGATLSGDTFTVDHQTGSFEVEIWYNRDGYSQSTVGTNFALGFDRTDGVGSTATTMDNVLNVTAVNANFTIDGHVASGIGDVHKRSAAATIGSGNNYDFISGAARPYVWNEGVYFLPGVMVDISHADMDFRIGTATVTYNLAFGMPYGDTTNEAGLFVVNQGGEEIAPNLGATGWVAPVGSVSHRCGSGKYMVTAVPEPATLVAMVAGVAALARRRKK